MRLECTVADAAEAAARVRATVPPPAAVADEVAAIVAAVRERGDAALHEYEARFGAATAGSSAGATNTVIVVRDELAAALAALDPAVRDGFGDGDPERPRGGRGRARSGGRGGAAAGPDRPAARGAGAAGGGVCAGRSPSLPVVRRDGRGHCSCGRRRRGRARGARPPGHPRRRGAVRGRRGVPDGRRAGGRGARVRHRDDQAGRRDRRPRQPVGAGGEAAGLGRGRHRRVRRARATSRSSSRKAPTPNRCAWT